MLMTDHDIECLKKLKNELRPRIGDEEKTQAEVEKAKQQFPIDTKVRIRHTNMWGKVVDYNRKVGGFYPGYLFPVYVEILHDDRVGRESAVGCVFEYSLDQLEVHEEN